MSGYADDVSRIEVRATINLPGLRAHRVALVDPAAPYIEVCLAAGYVVPTDKSGHNEHPTTEGDNMAEFEKGQKVNAFPDGGEVGLIGFVLGQGGDKHHVQIGSEVHELSYREPANYDEKGSGGTFKTL